MVLKFRAWHTPFKGKKFGQEMKYGRSGTLLSFAEMSPDDYILMQSTEFLDKEGNEIWDKDILDESYTNPMTGELVVVRYIVEKENGMWKLKDFKGRQQYDRYLLMRNEQCTRIGNVFENPELLEVEGK